MARCPVCRSRDVAAEQKKVEVDTTRTGYLVLQSWLRPGGILKNRRQYRTETTCICRSCGHSWQGRSRKEIMMAAIGAVILLCLILLGIFGTTGS